MGGVRSWIFRLLVVIGAALFVYSFLQPWWTAYIVALETTAINIYAHGLESFIPSEFAAWIAGYDQIMPGWFTPFMWAYMILCMLALAFSLFVSDTKKLGIGKIKISLPTLIPAIVGLSFIIVAVVAVLVISAQLPNFYNAPLNGDFYMDMGDPYISVVETGLLTSYYMAYVAGGLLLVTAVLRRFIVGKNND